MLLLTRVLYAIGSFCHLNSGCVDFLYALYCTSRCQVSYVANAIPLPVINGEVGEVLVPPILYDVSREQIGSVKFL